MGKHSQKRMPGDGDRRAHRMRSDARRVPAERRRTPGEHATAGAAHSGEESYRLSDPASRRRGSLESAPARLKVERDRRRARVKKIALGVLVGLLVLIIAGAVGVYAYAKHLERTMQTTVVNKAKLDAVLTKAQPMQPFNILILGADFRRGDTAYRSDSMIVAHVDPQQKKVWLLSIPRDARVEIPGHGANKINAAHYYGGPEGAIAATEKLTGLKINHYLEANFQGFVKAVDALGGVWVNVPVTIKNDPEADASIGDVASHIDAGYQLLDGAHALTFVRARHQFADEDFTRMKDQQIFFKALADQIAKIDNLAKLPGVVSAVAPYIATDMSLVDMIKLAQDLKGAGSKNLYTATARGPWKSPFVYVDEVYLKKLITDIKNGQPFDKSQAATSTAKPVAPSSIKVVVRNGAGTSGVANQAATILQAKGFKIGEVGNAGQNVYKKTLIIYKTDPAAANVVAKYLPPGTTIVASRGMYAFKGNVLVVIGKDWNIADVPAAPVITQ
jgi:LCP family protein required for cell wall assembly